MKATPPSLKSRDLPQVPCSLASAINCSSSVLSQLPGTRTCGWAVDGCDCGDGAIKDRTQQGGVFIPQCPLQIQVGGTGPVAQILAGAKRLAGACDHHNARAFARSFDRVGQLGAHLCGQCVVFLWPVEGDNRDIVCSLGRDGLVLHD